METIRYSFSSYKDNKVCVLQCFSDNARSQQCIKIHFSDGIFFRLLTKLLNQTSKEMSSPACSNMRLLSRLIVLLAFAMLLDDINLQHHLIYFPTFFPFTFPRFSREVPHCVHMMTRDHLDLMAQQGIQIFFNGHHLKSINLNCSRMIRRYDVDINH